MKSPFVDGETSIYGLFLGFSYGFSMVFLWFRVSPLNVYGPPPASLSSGEPAAPRGDRQARRSLGTRGEPRGNPREIGMDRFDIVGM